MIDRGKRKVLGVAISVIDYDAVVGRVVEAARRRRPLSVAALAVHGVMTGFVDPEHKHRLNGLDIVTPDGQPVRWALRFLYGERLADRVYGPELTTQICKAAERQGLSIYLYGSRRRVLDAWIQNLRTSHPNLTVAGSEASRFRTLSTTEIDGLIARIDASGADVVFVGLGCPRQETFVFENRDAMKRPLIAVGAAFDFHAGLLSQAPRWMQDRGLEWAFRLWQEPRRLWRRYLLNPLYLVLLGAQKLGLMKSRFERVPQSVPAKRYG